MRKGGCNPLPPEPDHTDCLAALKDTPFDYALLERKMWERVEEHVGHGAAKGSKEYAATVAAIRMWGFAYRLSKMGDTVDIDLTIPLAALMVGTGPIELLPAVEGHTWVKQPDGRFRLVPA